MLKAHFRKYTLQFKRPGGTSRGVLHTKDSWFIFLFDDEEPDRMGIGECGLLKGLSYDDRPGYEDMLTKVCSDPERGAAWLDDLLEWPSISFGWEMALHDFQFGCRRKFFDNAFLTGKQSIPINGLIWMGEPSFMTEQIEEKLATGFDCIKMKIGAIDFEKELALLKGIRDQFSAKEIELRVDANGAFAIGDAMARLNELAAFDLHSIEQPIKQGQWHEMASLCEETPLPIALDEELIGVTDIAAKERLLDTIKPQYIILKPSLVGGFRGTDEWIALAQIRHIPWWITSALESNIGLNAIAQYTFHKGVLMPQGLGTGSLYTNNFDSPLEVENGHLHYRPEHAWNLEALLNE